MAKGGSRLLEVAVSFDGLDKGAQFEQDPGDPWAAQHLKTGYLRDVTYYPEAAMAEGDTVTQASPKTVQEAKNAGEVGKG